jgi:hypothetical protein
MEVLAVYITRDSLSLSLSVFFLSYSHFSLSLSKKKNKEPGTVCCYLENENELLVNYIFKALICRREWQKYLFFFPFNVTLPLFLYSVCMPLNFYA